MVWVMVQGIDRHVLVHGSVYGSGHESVDGLVPGSVHELGHVSSRGSRHGLVHGVLSRVKFWGMSRVTVLVIS